MSDNLDHENLPNSNDDGEEVTDIPKRQRRKPSNDESESVPATLTETAKELDSSGHRHALPRNKNNCSEDKNKSIKEQQKPKSPTEPKPQMGLRPPRPRPSQTPNNIPQPESSQSSQNAVENISTSTQPEDNESSSNTSQNIKDKKEEDGYMKSFMKGFH